jgi:hypothetical protein
MINEDQISQNMSVMQKGGTNIRGNTWQGCLAALASDHHSSMTSAKTNDMLPGLQAPRHL